MVSVAAPGRAWDRGTGHSASGAPTPERSLLEVSLRYRGTFCVLENRSRGGR